MRQRHVNRRKAYARGNAAAHFRLKNAHRRFKAGSGAGRSKVRLQKKFQKSREKVLTIKSVYVII